MSESLGAVLAREEKKKKKERKPGIFDGVSGIVKQAFEETLVEFPVPRKSKIKRVVKKAVKKAITVIKPEETSIPQVRYSLTAGHRNMIFNLQSLSTFNDFRGNPTPIVLGNFYLEEMKGCKGIAVLYYLHVDTKYLRRGYGTFMHLVAEKIARACGFKYIQGTVIGQMFGERELLKGLKGWKVAYEFNNSNSGNTVYCYHKLLD